MTKEEYSTLLIVKKFYAPLARKYITLKKVKSNGTPKYMIYAQKPNQRPMRLSEIPMTLSAIRSHYSRLIKIYAKAKRR